MGAEATVIPYEEIDCEIRCLVRLLNDLPGIRTTGSCAGHGIDDGGDTQINFVADSQEAVAGLVAAMPFWGLRGGFVDSRPQVKTIGLTVAPGAGGGLLYSLWISGSPRFVQRRALGEVEQALASRLQDRSR